MTDSQIQEVIENIRPNIRRLAYIFLPKMKQPSFRDIKDLEREAEWVILFHIRRKDRIDNDKGKVSTYLIRGVVNHFSDLVRKSYKEDPILTTEIRSSLLSKNMISGRERELDLVRYIEERFTRREKEYLQHFLSPSEEIKEEMRSNRKSIRKIVRKHLSMLPEEERIVRENIKIKLLGFKI